MLDGDVNEIARGTRDSRNALYDLPSATKKHINRAENRIIMGLRILGNKSMEMYVQSRTISTIPYYLLEQAAACARENQFARPSGQGIVRPCV